MEDRYVHDETVIDLLIKDFDEEFYYAITKQEYYCYMFSGDALFGSIENYSVFFQELSDAILAYFNSFPSKDEFLGLMDSIYSFITLDSQFKLFESQKQNLYEHKVFTLAGYRAAVQEYDELYYDDIEQTVIDEDAGIYGFAAPRIEADIALITDTATADTIANVEALTAEINSITYTYVQKLMYQEVIPESETLKLGFQPPGVPYMVQVGTPPPKTSMFTEVFTNYGYERVFTVCNLTSAFPF